MRPVDIPSRRDEVSSRPTARTAVPVRVRYSQTSASTTRTTTPMNATGMKPMLVFSASMTSLLIGPSGWSRSSSDAPSRMLKVPSVAMIDGRRRIRMRVALKTPVARPTPTIASEPRNSAKVVSSGLSVNDAVTTHIVTSAATEMSKPPTSKRVRLADRDEREGHRREQEVVDVVLGQERVLTHRRVRADREDQHRQQHERNPAAEAHALRPRDAAADDRLDDPAFAELVPSDLVDDLPARHHDDAVAEPGELERIARLDDERHAFVRLRPQAPRRCRSARRRRRPGSAPRPGSPSRPRAGTGASARPSAGCRRRATEPVARSTPCGCAAGAPCRRPCAVHAGGAGSPAVRATAAPGSSCWCGR